MPPSVPPLSQEAQRRPFLRLECPFQRTVPIENVDHAVLGARCDYIPGCPDGADSGLETGEADLDRSIGSRTVFCRVCIFDVADLDLLQPASVQRRIESQASVTGPNSVGICGLSQTKPGKPVFAGGDVGDFDAATQPPERGETMGPKPFTRGVVTVEFLLCGNGEDGGLRRLDASEGGRWEAPKMRWWPDRAAHSESIRSTADCPPS
jgi:hypothetical protein